MLIQNTQQKDNLITLSSIKISEQKMKTLPKGRQMLQLIQSIIKKFSVMQLDHLPSEALRIVKSCQETYYCPKGVKFEEPNPENNQRGFLRIQSLEPICHIDFPNLRFLVLSSNNLSSVQALSFLNAPRLEKLGLQDNHISNLNALAKGHFPQLWSIIFYGNPINQLQKLDRSVSKKITYYKMDSSDCIYKNRVQDYRFLYKKLNPPPQYIGIEDQNRINIKKKGFYGMLKKQGTYIATSDDKINLA